MLRRTVGVRFAQWGKSPNPTLASPNWKQLADDCRFKSPNTDQILRRVKSLFEVTEVPTVPQLEIVLTALRERGVRDSRLVIRFMEKAADCFPVTDPNYVIHFLNAAYLSHPFTHQTYTVGLREVAARFSHVSIKGKITLMHLLAKLQMSGDFTVQKLRESFPLDIESFSDAHQIAVYLCAYFHVIARPSQEEREAILKAILANRWSVYPKHILVLISYCPRELMQEVHTALLPCLKFIVKHNLVVEVTKQW